MLESNDLLVMKTKASENDYSYLCKVEAQFSDSFYTIF